MSSPVAPHPQHVMSSISTTHRRPLLTQDFDPNHPSNNHRSSFAHPNSRHTHSAHRAADPFSLDSSSLVDSTGKDRFHSQSATIGGLDGSERAAAYNLCNFILGSGIIALPAAMGQAGLIVGICLLLLQSLTTNYSLRLLISCGLKLKVFDYEELLRTTFGKRGWYLGIASIFLLDFGVMVTFLIILTDTLTPVLSFYFNGTIIGAWFASRTFTLWLVSLIAILPVSLLRSMKELGWVSLVSIGSVALIVALLIAKIIFGHEEVDAPITKSDVGASTSLWTFTGTDFWSAFGCISFVFVCHDGSFAIFQSLSVPSQPRWNAVVQTSVLLAAIPSIILSVCGHLAFGGGDGVVHGNVLNHFANSDHAANIARLALATSMVMTYPLNLFMCRHVLTKMIGASSTRHLTMARHVTLTIVLFLASLTCATFLTDLGIVQSIVGATTGSLLAFILPALVAMRTAQMIEGRPYLTRDNLPNLFLLALGLTAVTTVTCKALFQ